MTKALEACQRKGQRVAVAVGRGYCRADRSPGWRVLRDFADQTVAAILRKVEDGEQVHRLGAADTGVGPGTRALVVARRHLHFIGSPGFEIRERGGGACANEVVGDPLGRAHLPVAAGHSP